MRGSVCVSERGRDENAGRAARVLIGMGNEVCTPSQNIPTSPFQAVRDVRNPRSPVSLAAVVDVGHYDVTRLIEAEKTRHCRRAGDTAFQRALQRLDVAAAVRGKRSKA